MRHVREIECLWGWEGVTPYLARSFLLHQSGAPALLLLPPWAVPYFRGATLSWLLTYRVSE